MTIKNVIKLDLINSKEVFAKSKPIQEQKKIMWLQLLTDQSNNGSAPFHVNAIRFRPGTPTAANIRLAVIVVLKNKLR